MEKFMKEAKSLSHNPLGIIALFISLIYGFACLVVTTGIKNISVGLQSRLIWFLVSFPFVILAAFVYLVTGHHSKLYAPKDYRKDGAFLAAMNVDQQRAKIIKDIEELDDSILEEKDNDSRERVKQTINKEKKTNKTENSTIDNESIDTEKIQKMPKEKYEVDSEIANKLMIIEDLVTRKLQEEFGELIQRQVSVNFLSSENIYVDGVFIKDDIYHLVEIKYIKNPKLSMGIIASMHHLSNLVESNDMVNVKLVFILVHPRGVGAKIQKLGHEQLTNLYSKVIVKTYSEDSLFKYFDIGNAK